MNQVWKLTNKWYKRKYSGNKWKHGKSQKRNKSHKNEVYRSSRTAKYSIWKITHWVHITEA